MSTWLRRLAFLLRQSRHDAELREEIEAHRAMRAERLARDGMSPEEADAASRRALGNVLLAREEAREAWAGSWFTWWHDVRFALRMFRKSPAFTAAAVLTLALGIGVNAGIVTVINGALFRNLPVPGADALVWMSQMVEGVPQLTGRWDVFSVSEYQAYRDGARSLSGILAIANARGEATVSSGVPRRAFGSLVSCNYFEVLQQPPLLGRGFVAQDCEPGAEPVVVLGHDLWRTAFGADPGIVGEAIQLNRQPFTVVGIAGEGAHAGAFLRVGYFAPLSQGSTIAPGDSRYEGAELPWLMLIGRLEDGARVEQARAELALIAARLDRQQPGRSTTVSLEPARAGTLPASGLRGVAGGAALVLMAAFGCILLIACANVANLLLARGTARRQEMGIRLSLGASRARVVRQLLTESLVLSVAGGVLGCVLAFWSVQALVGLAIPALLPPEFPAVLVVDVSPDGGVLAVAGALTLVTGLLFGLAPALHASQRDLHTVMKQDVAGASISRGGGRLRGALVGIQVALCMTLMVGAGLLARGLHATYTVDPGFDYRNVAFVSFESVLGVLAPEEVATLQRRLAADIGALPGIEAVAYTNREPLGDDIDFAEIRLPGETDDRIRVAQINSVTPDYFSVIGLRMVRGRTFTPQEAEAPETGTRPAVVSASTARNLWPGRDPIGRTVWSNRGTLEVVGVVADAQVTAIGQIDPYYVYIPGGTGVLLARSRGDFASTASSIQAAIRAVDPALALRVFPLEASLGWWRSISGIVTALGAGLGVLALVLATVGIYGLVSYSVAGRYREIGIRMALGASASSVLGMVLRQTMGSVMVGAAIGLAAAAVMSRVLSGVLFGVSPADPIGLGGAALLVIVVALASGARAARPATRIDPTIALRYE